MLTVLVYLRLLFIQLTELDISIKTHPSLSDSVSDSVSDKVHPELADVFFEKYVKAKDELEKLWSVLALIHQHIIDVLNLIYKELADYTWVDISVLETISQVISYYPQEYCELTFSDFDRFFRSDKCRDNRLNQFRNLVRCIFETSDLEFMNYFYTLHRAIEDFDYRGSSFFHYSSCFEVVFDRSKVMGNFLPGKYKGLKRQIASVFNYQRSKHPCTHLSDDTGSRYIEYSVSASFHITVEMIALICPKTYDPTGELKPLLTELLELSNSLKSKVSSIRSNSFEPYEESAKTCCVCFKSCPDFRLLRLLDDVDKCPNFDDQVDSISFDFCKNHHPEHLCVGCGVKLQKCPLCRSRFGNDLERRLQTYFVLERRRRVTETELVRKILDS